MAWRETATVNVYMKEETKQQDSRFAFTSIDLVCRPLIKKILEYAADECNGLQRCRDDGTYNEGATDAADAVENLDIEKMLDFIRDKEKRDVEKGRNPQTTGLFEW